MRHRPTRPLARPARCALALAVMATMAGCTAPGFLRQAEPAPTPALLPIEDILTGESAQLDAEAAAALSARGAALRTRAQATP